MNTVIRLTNLSKTFIDTNNNVHAVNGVDLSVNFGEIFGIIGSSGAGKSTLLRCINFLEIPTQGSVIFDGSDLGSLKHKKLRQARREIGMIFQSFNLLKQRTVFKNVLLPFEINRFKGTTRQKAHEKVLGLLELVGLSDKLNAYPAQLSG
ncbi:MAG: ATP-binding cassette domain-containing protein, partial [Firmicutes bacterium]|nr:ATP-binding cassette domain-containing protein [Bacillota bacterium]